MMAQITYRKSLHALIPPWKKDSVRKQVEYDLRNYVLPVHHMTRIVKLDGTFYKRMECKEECHLPVTPAQNVINFDKIVLEGDTILLACDGLDIVEKIDVKKIYGKTSITLENLFQQGRRYFYSVESAKEENMKYLTYGIVNITILSGQIVLLKVEEVFDVHEFDQDSYYITLVHKTQA